MADFNVEFAIDDMSLNLHETKIIVDDELSSSSTNPVQNKVITGEINDLKQEMYEITVSGTSLVINSGLSDANEEEF